MKQTSRELDAILAGVHDEIEGGASGTRVRDIADAHPWARDDILAFAAEWAASCERLETVYDVTREMRRFMPNACGDWADRIEVAFERFKHEA